MLRRTCLLFRICIGEAPYLCNGSWWKRNLRRQQIHSLAGHGSTWHRDVWWSEQDWSGHWVSTFFPITISFDLLTCSSALAGYHANGNKNGWPTADPGQQKTVSDLFDTGIHSPGVVMIPICDPELVVLNWSYRDTTAPGYPCQPQSASKRRRSRRSDKYGKSRISGEEKR